jgi:hypothetical protein
MRPTACTVRGIGASLLTKGACEPRYSSSRKIPADGEDAARRTRQRGQDIPAGSNRSPFHHIRSATAIARGWPIPDAHRPKAADEDVTVDGVAVTNDVSRRSFPTTGLGELVRNPFRRWVRGHSQPQDLAAIVMQDQQSVEQSERDCRDHE